MNLPSEIQIGNGDAKIWIATGLLIVLAMFVANWIRRRSIRRFATSDRIQSIFRSGPGKQLRFFAKGVGLILAIILLTLGLMDFRWGKIQREVPQEGVEVMFLLDVSRSMLAEDVTPNRLERAKQMIRDMITAMAGDRVGLVVFAGETRRMIPLTNHYEDFNTALSDIDPDSVRRGGSKLGNAIEVAGDSFLSKTNSQRVMVVLTDGEDQESEPAKVAKNLKEEQGIRIFTVGLGDMETGAKIPDAESQRYVRYQGQTVVTKLDGEILQQVAQVSGGAYVPAGTKQVDMKAVYDRYIAGMEKNEFDTAKIDAYEARFQWFAIPALVILLLEAFGISLPRRSQRLVALMMVALLSSPSAFADERLETVEAVNLTKIYNQGVRSFRDGDFESAIERFDQAGRASDGELASTARYNAATARISRVQADLKEGKSESAKDELQAAIDRLRLALRLRPRWQDARANLEIAVRLMDQLNQDEPEQPQGESKPDEDSDSQNDTNKPDQSDKPDQSGSPDQPDKPDQSGSPDQPDKQGEPENKNQPENQEPSEPKDDSPNPSDQNSSPNESNDEQTPDSKDSAPPNTSNGEQEDSDSDNQDADRQQPDQPQTGELEADNEQSTKPSSGTGDSAKLGEPESMTEDEARKMLQAVRDRDMIRRFRQQQLRRSRQVPVDKDW